MHRSSLLYKMEEEWRLIEGFPNYEVSSLGRVRNRTTGQVLKPAIRTIKLKTRDYAF